MPSKLVGTAVSYAMDGVTCTFSGIASTQNEPTAASLRDNFDKVDIKGKDGRTISRGATNRRHALTLDVVFKHDGSPATRAGANAQAKLPDPLAVVTLAGFGNTLLDGTWNYVEGTLSRSSEGAEKATITLERMEAADGSVSSMAAVS